MNATTATPPTKEERDAMFDRLFAGITPSEKKQPTIAELLAPYRSQIAAKHKDGYSLRQIADRLKEPPLSITVSPSTLMHLIAGAAAKRRAQIKKLAALRAANLAAGKLPAPAAVPAATGARKP